MSNTKAANIGLTIAADIRVNDVIRSLRFDNDNRVVLVTKVIVCADGTRFISGKCLSTDEMRFNRVSEFFDALSAIDRTFSA